MREARLVQPVLQLKVVQLTTCHCSEFLQLRLNLVPNVGREYARQVFAQKGVVLVLVAKARRRLGEEVTHNEFIILEFLKY